METCPDVKFQNFVRKEFTVLRSCLNKKISWTMIGVVVATFSVIAYLTYDAYSGGQQNQTTCIEKNTKEVQDLETTTKVIEANLLFIKEQLREAKSTQVEGQKAIMEELKRLNLETRGGKE